MQNLIDILKTFQSKGITREVVRELPEHIFQIDRHDTISNYFSIDDKIFSASESIIGKSMDAIYPPEWLSKIEQSVAECRKSNQVVSLECFMTINTTEHFYEIRVIPDEPSVFIFINDITETRSSQLKDDAHRKQLIESEQRFRLLADHLPGAVYLCNNDADFSMLYLNEKVFEITGYAPAEFILKKINFPEIYHPDDVARIYAEVEKKLAEKKSFHLEYRIMHKSGEIRWIEEFGTGVFIDNHLTCLEGYLQDITDRKNAEIKILHQNDALIKANEELDQFVYSTSHDLRSPLSSLLGLINLGLLSNSPEDFKTILLKMKDRVSDLDYFIKEITQYSQNARLGLDNATVPLLQVVQESIELLENMEEAKSILFEVKIPAQLNLHTDVRRMKIILNNLIANAIKYADSGKSQQWVKIDSKVNGNECTITIEDNGLGIKAEFHDKIFNMFYRASERSTGSGLGLYIVKETASRMNGKITFRSVEGAGSVFTFSLPLSQS